VFTAPPGAQNCDAVARNNLDGCAEAQKKKKAKERKKERKKYRTSIALHID
jgi:hypothetical protein